MTNRPWMVGEFEKELPVRSYLQERASTGVDKAMGIREVAKKASVSTATVSRVITGAAKVSPSTTTRVLRAIRALDFQANEAARALAVRKKLKRNVRKKPKRGDGGSPKSSKVLFSSPGSSAPKGDSDVSGTVNRGRGSTQ